MFSGLQLAETKKHWFKILRLKVVAKASKIQMIFFESWSHGKNVGQISCFMAFQEPIMGPRNKKKLRRKIIFCFISRPLQIYFERVTFS